MHQYQLLQESESEKIERAQNESDEFMQQSYSIPSHQIKQFSESSSQKNIQPIIQPFDSSPRQSDVMRINNSASVQDRNEASNSLSRQLRPVILKRLAFMQMRPH